MSKTSMTDCAHTNLKMHADLSSEAKSFKLPDTKQISRAVTPIIISINYE